jgi:hypothetical protein
VPSFNTKLTIRAAIAIVTLFLDACLIYLNFFFPLTWIFVPADQPWKSPSNLLANVIGYSVIALILVLNFFLFYRFRKLPRTFYLAPVFTLLFIGEFVIRGIVAGDAPNTTVDSTGSGYYYRTEVWFYGSNGAHTNKRWKSKGRYDGKTDPNELRYLVDSVWSSK